MGRRPAGGGRSSALTVTRRAEDHVVRSSAPAKTPTASFLISLAMPASFLSRQSNLSPAPRSYLRRARRRGEKQAKPRARRRKEIITIRAEIYEMRNIIESMKMSLKMLAKLISL